jgi:hypothetical protein
MTLSMTIIEGRIGIVNWKKISPLAASEVVFRNDIAHKRMVETQRSVAASKQPQIQRVDVKTLKKLKEIPRQQQSKHEEV